MGRFLSVDPVTFIGSGGNPGYFNRYAYVMNDPINANDPTGMYCNSLNARSNFCARSQLFANYDAALSSKTTFFAAASLTTETLASIDGPMAGVVSSRSSRAHLRQLSSQLQNVNSNAAGKLFLSGSTSIVQTDKKLVRMEQDFVQGYLDNLKGENLTEYEALVNDANASLNGIGRKVDANYGKILDSVRSDLGRDIDFSKKSDRVAIGDAVTSAIRNDSKVTCTGSRIKRSSC